MPNNAPTFDARGHAGRPRWPSYALLSGLLLAIGALALVLLPAQTHSDPKAPPSREASSAPVRSTPPTTALPVAGNTSFDEPQTTAEPPAPTPPTPTGYGCAAALAYLAANANPEFTFSCPGYADGNEAMTCVNIAGLCGGEHLIVINDPCPAAYMNEAYNSQSWSDSEARFTRPIDPYGAC
jgi:hypothetical protein